MPTSVNNFSFPFKLMEGYDFHSNKTYLRPKRLYCCMLKAQKPFEVQFFVGCHSCTLYCTDASSTHSPCQTVSMQPPLKKEAHALHMRARSAGESGSLNKLRLLSLS